MDEVTCVAFVLIGIGLGGIVAALIVGQWCRLILAETARRHQDRLDR